MKVSLKITAIDSYSNHMLQSGFYEPAMASDVSYGTARRNITAAVSYL
jgi:hypothetical protein